ncbi:GNAT family N-acetyltransferase [Rheinheimera sp. D18]|uniref:GNAT family N-acetyltransferase n=1 Tax=Rheinheimera sp. D18 TaxID=2545632 RepID=UPI001043DCF7|nr:GNAT family N-acetyltransferase [Rheinheimera sp. D18]QBL09503.1 GNAT family N-acetyltransferase [Rheinheimera sp. D18]
MTTIRLITPADLPAVITIQDSCYSDALFEAPELLNQRLAAQPQSCWLAESNAKHVLAYLLSYPAMIGDIAPLGSPFKQVVNANTLYLHDMAVDNRARGLGLAQQLLQQALRFAAERGLTNLALVAVQGAVPYWQRNGFSTVAVTSDQGQQALHSYTGQQAVYMQKPLI